MHTKHSPPKGKGHCASLLAAGPRFLSVRLLMPPTFHSLKKQYRPSISDSRAEAYTFTRSLKNIIRGLCSVPRVAVIIYFFWTCFRLLKHVNTLSPSSFPGLYWQGNLFLFSFPEHHRTHFPEHTVFINKPARGGLTFPQQSLWEEFNLLPTTASGFFPLAYFPAEVSRFSP